LFAHCKQGSSNILSGAMYSIKLALGKSIRSIRPEPIEGQSHTNTAGSLAPMLSPCIGVCELNAANVCTGCHRSSSEIGAWSSMTDAARSQIMARLDQREAD